MWKRTVEALSVAFLQIKPQYVVGLGYTRNVYNVWLRT